MSGKRIECMDCARALCMLFIVGIYHMNGYLADPIFETSDLTTMMVTSALATFSFISGYFLGKKPMKDTRDALAFYRGRFVRMYPLFLLSCASLYVASVVYRGFFSSPLQLLLTLVGVSCYVGMTPGTVWYISMLLSFYLITPPILLLRGRGKRIAAAVLLFMLFVWLKYAHILRVDYRIILYFPLYCAGLIYAEKGKIGDRSHWPALIASAAALIGLYLLKRTIRRDAAVAFAGAVFLIEIGKLCAKVPPLRKLLKPVSYASMTAYLFHRQFFGVCELLIGPFPRAVAFALLLPLCIALCYAAQIIYDRLAKKVFRTQ